VLASFPWLHGRRLSTWVMFMTFPPTMLAASLHMGAVQRFLRACVYHRLSCPLSHEADTMLPPSPMGGVLASHIGSPTASGRGPTGNVSSTLSVHPRRKGRLAKR
jgi:hypothetical protein